MAVAEDASKKKYAHLDQLSTEELKAILRASALSEEADDPALIDYVLEVIMQREKEQYSFSRMGQAREEFEQFYQGLESPLYPIAGIETEDAASDDGNLNVSRRKKRRVRYVLIAAAVIAVLVSMTCVPVFGYTNVVQMVIAYWTDDYFTFGPGTVEAGNTTNGRELFPDEFSDFYDALTQEDIKIIALPRYIPKELNVEDSVLYVSPRTGAIDFSVQYQSPDGFLLLTATQNQIPSQIVVEKDAEIVKRYFTGDAEYYFFSNNGANTVTWNVDGLDYAITSSLSIDALQEIIDSIEI